MKNEEDSIVDNKHRNFQILATILFFAQFVIFFLIFNFSINIVILGAGWIFLFFGFALVLLSTNLQEKKTQVGIYRVTPYIAHLGWSIVSLSIALIIQLWFMSLLSIGFIIIMILDVRHISKSFE